MAFSNTKPHMSLLLATFMTCFLLLLNKAMSVDSISFSSYNFPNNPRDINFQGDAKASNGVLLLNRLDAKGNPTRGSQGQARFGAPIHLWERRSGRVASISTTFTFNIRKTAGTPGDGLTFFLTPVGSTLRPGSNGGHLGVYGNTGSDNFVAVEFDTYGNTWDPRTAPHIGIDINNVTSVQTANWNTAGVPNGATALVTITYSANSKELTVTLTYPNVPGTATSTLTYKNLDFQRLLPEWVEVGFSAATGDFVETHQISTWSFTSDLSYRRSNQAIKEVV